MMEKRITFQAAPIRCKVALPNILIKNIDDVKYFL
jgi:hypothetical protein